jgi:hypothetical protein
MTAATGRDLKTAGDMAAVLDRRLTPLTPTNPGPLPWLPGIPETLHDHPVWGAYLAKRPYWSPTSPTRSKTTPANVTPSQSGHHREATRPPPSSAKSQCGGPPTASSPRPATNRGNPTRNASGPVETTPRPGHRACDRPASRCDGRRATGRTHRTYSQPLRHAAPLPTARTASERAVRAAPIAHATVVTLQRPDMRMHATRRPQDEATACAIPDRPQPADESGSLIDQEPG